MLKRGRPAMKQRLIEDRLPVSVRAYVLGLLEKGMSCVQIAQHLADQTGINVSHDTVTVWVNGWLRTQREEVAA